MEKAEVYQKERMKLLEIFKCVEPEKQKLVEGLIDEAAFLFSENIALKSVMAETGMVKIHPKHKDIQKPVAAAVQYLKNANTYAVLVKALGSVLNKANLDDGDELSDYE